MDRDLVSGGLWVGNTSARPPRTNGAARLLQYSHFVILQNQTVKCKGVHGETYYMNAALIWEEGEICYTSPLESNWLQSAALAVIGAISSR